MALVSEPVKVNWKKGKDLTQGLTDAAIKLWDAQHKTANGSGGKAAADLPEKKEIIELIDGSDSASQFFALFGYVGEQGYITAEESKKNEAAEQERRAKAKSGEEDDDEDEPMELDFEEAEVCPQGAEIAITIAEDIWPNAIKYFSEFAFQPFLHSP